MKLVYLILIGITLSFGKVVSAQTISFSTGINLKPYCPTPGNQEGENTCVGFVFAHAMTLLKAIEIQDKEIIAIDKYRFSPHFLYNQIKLDNHKGAKYSTAICFLKQEGNCQLTDFNKKESSYGLPDSTAVKKAQAYRIKSGGIVFDNRNTMEQKIDLLKQMLQDSIPVILNFRAYKSFVQLPKGSFFWSKKREADDVYQDHHGLLVVGFDDTHFEVMNSWGTDWANNGFVKMTHEVLAQNSIRGYAISFKITNSDALQSLPVENLEINSKLGDYIPPSIFQKPNKVFIDKSIIETGQSMLNKAIVTADGNILAVGSYLNSQQKQQLLFSKVQVSGVKFFTHKGTVNELYNEYGISGLELTDSRLLLSGYAAPSEKDAALLQSNIWLNFHDANGKKTKRRVLKKSTLSLKLGAMELLDNQLVFAGLEDKTFG